jgi:hypothetical protein
MNVFDLLSDVSERAFELAHTALEIANLWLDIHGHENPLSQQRLRALQRLGGDGGCALCHCDAPLRFARRSNPGFRCTQSRLLADLVMAKKSQPRGRCIFCRRTGLSKEHVWADWLKNYIPRTMKTHTRFSAIVHPAHSEPRRKTKQGDPHTSKLRVVCENHCNNGWMSRLQNAAKPYLLPLIKGEVTALDEKAQRIIATWAAMAVMVAEYFDRYKVAISATERKYLWKNQRPPPNWKIWIGHYERKNWPGHWVHNVLPISSKKNRIKRMDNGLPRPNTQTTTFVVGQLYIHAASSATDIFEKWRLTTNGARQLVQIWPLRRNIVGWPTQTLTDREADQIAGAFFLFAEEIGGGNRT